MLKPSFLTCVLKESGQGFWGKGSVTFESKSYQVCNQFYSNDVYLSPLKYTEGNCALEGVYCIEVEEGIRKIFNDKRRSIISSKAHLHKNGKAFPHYSEYGQLKPDPHRQAPVHGTYGWLPHKDVYVWAKKWRVLTTCTIVRRWWKWRRYWWWWSSLIPFRRQRCVQYWGWYCIPR